MKNAAANRTPRDEMATELRLQIILERPPAGVDYALQKGHGSTYEPVDKQRSKGSDLAFELMVGVRRNRDATPVFSGPFVQGAKSEKFVYLDIGTYAGQAGAPWGRRLKIPLTGIAWTMIEKARAFEARVPGRDGKGEPSCAYVWRRQVGPHWAWRMLSKT